MAEQDAQLGARIDVIGRVVGRLVHDALGRRTREAHAVALDGELDRTAVEQRQASEIVGLPALRERIVPAREVVVAEHGDRRVASGGHELRRCGREARRGAAARDEVARDGDDVGLELCRPARRSDAAAAGPGRSRRARRRRAGP